MWYFKTHRIKKEKAIINYILYNSQSAKRWKIIALWLK